MPSLPLPNSCLLTYLIITIQPISRGAPSQEYRSGLDLKAQLSAELEDIRVRETHELQVHSVATLVITTSAINAVLAITITTLAIPTLPALGLGKGN